MCAGRFLDMPEKRPQRGAASGGERRSRGAAKSMAAPQGRSRAALGHRGPVARARVLLAAGLRRLLIGDRTRRDARAGVRDVLRRGVCGRLCTGSVGVCARLRVCGV